MPFSVVMPALEMAQETGKLLAWRKKEGDCVSKGEPLLEIETDKAVVEVEAPADGVLAGIKAAAGADIPVGQTIAWIVAPGEAPPAESEWAEPPRAQTDPAPARLTPAISQLAPATRPKLSPKARRLAQELGVDLSSVRGSGPEGEILACDVQAVAGAPGVPPPGVMREKSARIQVPSALGRIMAERTTQSWTTVPHFFVTRDMEAGALDQYRERIVAEVEKKNQVRITHTDLFVALAARVLLKHPWLNASWSPQGIHFHDYVHAGVAIAASEGVVAGVIPNAHAAALAEIAIQRRDIAERARAGRLRPADIANATFTISNLGMYKVDQFSAIITPPQVAILAVGAIRDRVVAVEGQPAIRPMMTLTISCDHRVADGARAARFLSDLADAVREPEAFLN
jgi:pyruvate dehydrogenase E2 component (dihydrolipoamide acetyltransferase)